MIQNRFSIFHFPSYDLLFFFFFTRLHGRFSPRYEKCSFVLSTLYYNKYRKGRKKVEAPTAEAAGTGGKAWRLSEFRNAREDRGEAGREGRCIYQYQMPTIFYPFALNIEWKKEKKKKKKRKTHSLLNKRSKGPRPTQSSQKDNSRRIRYDRGEHSSLSRHVKRPISVCDAAFSHK